MNNEPARSGESSPEPGDSRVPAKRASDAQLRANRQNAKRSTGPRTVQGKARSAANSVKHGIYATKAAAILSGPYPEDPDEIADQMQAIIDALAPRDALEEGIASEFALISLKERRLATFEDGQLTADGEAYDYERSTAADLALASVYRAIGDWDHARIAGNPTVEPTPEANFPWQKMAKCVQLARFPRTWVKDVWTETITPGTPEEWQDVFTFLVSDIFPAHHDLGIWLSKQDADHQDRSNTRSLRAHRVVALNSIEVVERGTALRTRLVQEKFKLLAMYKVFQERNFG